MDPDRARPRSVGGGHLVVAYGEIVASVAVPVAHHSHNGREWMGLHRSIHPQQQRSVHAGEDPAVAIEAAARQARRGSDRDVVRSIAIHVAAARDGKAEPLRDQSPWYHDQFAAVATRKNHESACSGNASRTFVAAGGHQVRIAVEIQVARQGVGMSDLRTKRGVELAEEQSGPSRVDLGFGVRLREVPRRAADHEIRTTIAINVAGRAERVAEESLVLSSREFMGRFPAASDLERER
jgi:hypothetical protein